MGLNLLFLLHMFYGYHINTDVYGYSLTGFTVQTSVLPTNGTEFGKAYDSSTKGIWLINWKEVDQNIFSWRKNVYSYDIKNDSFINRNSTEGYMNGYSQFTTQIGDTVYFLNSGHPRTFGSYNYKTKEWIVPFTTLLLKVKIACVTSSDDRYIYIIGGVKQNEYINDFQVYDLQQSIWITNVPKLIEPRGYAACSSYNGNLYVIGGFDGNTSSNSIEYIHIGSGNDVINNLESNSWILLSSILSFGRDQIETVICSEIDSNLMYLIGGYISTSHDIYTVNTIEIFNMTDHTTEVAPFTLNVDRASPAVFCVDDYIYVFGGYSADSGDSLDSWEKSNSLYTISPTQSPTNIPTNVPSDKPYETYSSVISTTQKQSATSLSDGSHNILIIILIISVAIIIILLFLLISYIQSYQNAKRRRSIQLAFNEGMETLNSSNVLPTSGYQSNTIDNNGEKKRFPKMTEMEWMASHSEDLEEIQNNDILNEEMITTDENEGATIKDLFMKYQHSIK